MGRSIHSAGDSLWARSARVPSSADPSCSATAHTALDSGTALAALGRTCYVFGTVLCAWEGRRVWPFERRVRSAARTRYPLAFSMAATFSARGDAFRVRYR